MKRVSSIIWGLVFICLGVVIALNALDIAHIDLLFDGWWTLFIFVPCFVGLFEERGKTGNVIGLFIGIFLLLCCQGIFNFSLLWKLLFPAILIIIGLSFIFKDMLGQKISKEIKAINEKNKGKDQTEYWATFSSQKVKLDEEFKGASLNAVFGGVTLDLTKAKFKDDQVIDASAIFGGVTIIVPSNVKVRVKTTPIFGGSTNKAEDNDGKVTIYVNALALFGGVEVK